MLKGHPGVRLAISSSPSSIQCSQHGFIFLSHKNLGLGPENLAQLRLPSGEFSEAAEMGGTRFSLEEKESNVSFLSYWGTPRHRCTSLLHCASLYCASQLLHFLQVKSWTLYIHQQFWLALPQRSGSKPTISPRCTCSRDHTSFFFSPFPAPHMNRVDWQKKRSGPHILFRRDYAETFA